MIFSKQWPNGILPMTSHWGYRSNPHMLTSTDWRLLWDTICLRGGYMVPLPHASHSTWLAFTLLEEELTVCLFQQGWLLFSLSCSINWRHKFLLHQPQLNFSGKWSFPMLDFDGLPFKQWKGNLVELMLQCLLVMLEWKMWSFLTYLGFKRLVNWLQLLTF